MRTTTRARLTATAFLLPIVMTAGCLVGRWNRATIESPLGATATVRNDAGRSDGELLFIRDDGAVILIDNRIVLSRWADMNRFTVEAGQSVRLRDGRAPTSSQRETMRRLSRYPFGLSPEQLDALLESVGQSEILVAGTPADAFVRAARTTVVRYEDRGLAIRDGFRQVGPDFPGMGEHWVQPGRVVDGRLDPARPPVLSYVTVDGTPVLIGMAWTLPLGPHDQPPAEPFDPGIWHHHSSAVDEEVLLLGHAPAHADEADAFRLSMVHIWTGLDNPDGILAQNNWALPFWRNGLPVPDSVSLAAARAVSLAYDGRGFYMALLDNAADLTAPEHAAVERVVALQATRAETLIAAHLTGSAGTVDQPGFEAIWNELWNGIRGIVTTETWAVLSRYAEAAVSRH